MQLHTADGQRKYLTAGERDGFLREAERADRDVRTLCMTLAYGGCRRSEALTSDRVDLAAGVLVFESLKNAAWGFFAACPSPCPARRTRPGARDPGAAGPAWQRPRRAALALVAHDRLAGGACGDAGRLLDGVAASPKGLRQGFGVATVTAGIPLNLVQKWLGHAQLSTTVGAEEGLCG
jgi:integrase